MDHCNTGRSLTDHPLSLSTFNRLANSTTTLPSLPPQLKDGLAVQSHLVKAAFSRSPQRPDRGGLAVAVHNALLETPHRPHVELVQTAMGQHYYRRQPNCLMVAVSSGMRGAVVGSVFGAAMGLSTAVQSGYKGSAALTYAGQGALRNAATFGSWTATYGLTRCSIVRVRGRDDIFGAAMAGAVTGGALTLVSTRGYWRYSQSIIATNAAASAMIAVMFHALNQI